MLGVIRKLVRNRWHVVSAAVALCAVPVAIWAWAGAGSPALAAVLGTQAIALIALSIVFARMALVDRRTRGLETRIKKLTSAVEQVGKATPKIDLGPLLDGIGAQRLDAALRHEELLERHRGLEALQEALAAEVARSRDQVSAHVEKETEQLGASIAALAANLTTGMADGAERVDREFRALDQKVDVKFEDALAENAALHNLYRITDIEREVPVPGGFAASPQTLLRLLTLTLELPADRLVVECGSGASTVWFAHACRHAGSGRVVALEHDEKYAQLTQSALERNGLTEWAEVRLAPLETIDVGGTEFAWYARSAWSQLDGIHLLFADGPPGRVGPRSRYPAFPLLGAVLTEGAVVALDDVQRSDETGIGKSWLKDGAGDVRLVDSGRVGRTWFFSATRSPG